MADQILSKWNPREFVLASQAMQDTTWFTDPANPTMAETGPIYKDELIWLQQELFGAAQPGSPPGQRMGRYALLTPHHFNTVTP